MNVLNVKRDEKKKKRKEVGVSIYNRNEEIKKSI